MNDQQVIICLFCLMTICLVMFIIGQSGISELLKKRNRQKEFRNSIVSAFDGHELLSVEKFSYNLKREFGGDVNTKEMLHFLNKCGMILVQNDIVHKMI